jgi:hypothetical protein
MRSSKKTKRKASKANNRNTFKYAGLVIACLVILVAILEVTNTTYLFHKKDQSSTTVLSGAGSLDKGTNNTIPAPQPNTSSKSVSTGTASSSSNQSVVSSVPPKEPYGDFVSSHTIENDGNEASVCITTPGISCSITFTQNSVTKTLPKKVTDNNGAAYWNWKPSDIGLSAGSWTITAIAYSGNLTASSKDARELVVQ